MKGTLLQGDMGTADAGRGPNRAGTGAGLEARSGVGLYLRQPGVGQGTEVSPRQELA